MEFISKIWLNCDPSVFAEMLIGVNTCYRYAKVALVHTTIADNLDFCIPGLHNL